MPMIFLSPSTQDSNLYITGGSEEQWMNRLADALVPLLTSSGIRYVRNTPDMTAASSIEASNAGDFDLHLALHSNASPEASAGQNRGILAFFYPTSAPGRRAAELAVQQFREIYPLPGLVRIQSTTAIGEVARVRATSLFLEIGYHDNYEDATWITGNLGAIARAVALTLTRFFGIPFFSSSTPRPAVVRVSWGYLNIRSRPDLTAPVVARAYDGAALTVLNEWQGWFLVRFGELVGYASGNYITFV